MEGLLLPYLLQSLSTDFKEGLLNPGRTRLFEMHVDKYDQKAEDTWDR